MMTVRTWLAVAMLLVLGSWRTPSASGVGVGGDGPAETSHALIPIYQVPEAPFQWGAGVGTPEQPIPIEVDAQGHVWQKTFQPNYGNRFFRSGDHIFIVEYFVVAGDGSWTGWQQTLNLATFDWIIGGWIGPQTSVKVNGAIAPGLTIQRSDPTPGEGASLAFSFDPILPGSQVNIVSEILYSGTTELRDPLVIRELPLPEPSTLMVLVATWSLLLLRRPPLA